MLLTFEGPDGSGKTTQIAYFDKFLKENNVEFIKLREPGGTRIGEQIREVLHNIEHREMVPRAEALLYQAARAQLVAEIIRPALNEGKLVLCDRFFDSTLAYQGYGHGMDLEELKGIINFATSGLTPDLTIYINIDAEEGLMRRQRDSGAEWNRLDALGLQFHSRVAEGYERLIEESSGRIRVVNGNQDKELVRADINRIIVPRLIEGGFLEGQLGSRERRS